MKTEDFKNTQEYKYGFTTDIGVEEFEKGLNAQVIKKISKKKNEPDFLLKFREKAFLNWQKMSSPNWAYLQIPPIDYEKIQYYSVPRTKKKLGSLEDADPELLNTFDNSVLTLSNSLDASLSLFSLSLSLSLSFSLVNLV